MEKSGDWLKEGGKLQKVNYRKKAVRLKNEKFVSLSMSKLGKSC